MAGPRKAVAERNPQQRIPGMMRGKGNDCDHQSQEGSDGVHPAVSCLAVLFQIEAEEFLIGAECPQLRHGKQLSLSRSGQLGPPASVYPECRNPAMALLFL